MRDCVSVIFVQLYGSNARLLKVIYSGWVSVTPYLHIGSQKTADIILWVLMSLVFVASKGKKIRKILTKKLMKLVKMEGLMRNNEIPRKNATYDDIKSDKKIKFKFRQHIF